MSATAKIIIHVDPDMATLTPAYFLNRKKDLATLITLRDQKNFDEISKLSHKTKGTAAGYGFATLGELAKELEASAKARDLGRLSIALDAMISHIESIELILP